MAQQGILKKIKLIPFDLLDQSSMVEALCKLQPDEIYNLAAQSFVGASFEQPVATGEMTGLGLTRLLDAVHMICPEAKFYQASSFEMYGKVQAMPQDETTPFYPLSPYAAAKLYAHCVAVNYRQAYDMFVCCGILFNHESPLRGLEFVTRKITYSVARIKHALQDELRLGNPAKAVKGLGWIPTKTPFKTLVEMMVESDMKLVEHEKAANMGFDEHQVYLFPHFME